MSDAPTLIYLEIDDEITSVVRRVRAADPGRVVIVAPGRSRATSSSVALRLLARAAEGDGRQIAIVGDALTRSLAAEAGLAAYGGVADARRADPAERAEPGESHTAAIHIVRGEAADDTAPTLMAAAATSDAETRSVPVAHPASVAARPRPSTRRPARRRISVAAALAGLAAVLVAWGAVGAAVLPAATIAITPRSEAIGPEPDVIRMADADSISDTIRDTATVTASGSYDIRAAATGSATFFNFNFFDVVVPAESLVATGREEGDQAYLTVEAVTVPAGVFDPFFGGITAGEASAPITAAAIGSDGNVEAGVIDTVLDPDLEGQLRGFPTITEPLVTNPEPTSGGDERSGVEITQEDVDAAVAELREALEQAAAEALAPSESLLFADPVEPPRPTDRGGGRPGRHARHGDGGDQRVAVIRPADGRSRRRRRTGRQSLQGQRRARAGGLGARRLADDRRDRHRAPRRGRAGRGCHRDRAGNAGHRARNGAPTRDRAVRRRWGGGARRPRRLVHRPVAVLGRHGAGQRLAHRARGGGRGRRGR